VILQRNINVGNGLVNGAQGVIDRFIEYDRAYQQRGSSSEDETKDRILMLRSDQVKTSCAISVATLSPLCSRWSCPTTTRIWRQSSWSALSMSWPSGSHTRCCGLRSAPGRLGFDHPQSTGYDLGEGHRASWRLLAVWRGVCRFFTCQDFRRVESPRINSDQYGACCRQ
jgi:hypothetical protein